MNDHIVLLEARVILQEGELVVEDGGVLQVHEHLFEEDIGCRTDNFNIIYTSTMMRIGDAATKCLTALGCSLAPG